MKKQICMICILLAAALLLPMTAAVAAETEDDDIYAVATTESGREITLADAPDAGLMGDLESYDLIVDDEPVLSVEQSDVPDITSGADNNGYFSASFDLPATTKHVFLAGLTAGKVEEIQNRIIEKYASGTDFVLEDLSFIDAEKKRPQNDGDDALCWAAANANMLTYTGWAAQAGFETTDDVFEEYIASFSDVGSNPFLGIGWFFNGGNIAELYFGPGNAPSAAEGTGGYFNDYAYDMVAEELDFDGSAVSTMKKVHRALEDGCAVTIGVSLYYNGEYFGGHSLTCWGYVDDTAYGEDEPERYAGMFFTESDLGSINSGDRRDAPNELIAVSLTPGTDANGALTFECSLAGNDRSVLSSGATLLPYSADLEKETAADATRDKMNTPDLYIPLFYLDTDLSAGSVSVWAGKIESSTAFYYSPCIYNLSDRSYSGRTKISVVITDSEGRQILSRDLNPQLALDPFFYTDYGKKLVCSSGLPEGDYTITVSVNGDHAVTEAYYYNNVRSFDFRVRDSYLLGDADGSGIIEVTDATKIQRIIADYDEGTDDRMLQRAQIIGGELSVLEATLIQRYIADYSVNFPVGEKRLYD